MGKGFSVESGSVRIISCDALIVPYSLLTRTWTGFSCLATGPLGHELTQQQFKNPALWSHYYLWCVDRLTLCVDASALAAVLCCFPLMIAAGYCMKALRDSLPLRV
jgi:hypothetical protein